MGIELDPIVANKLRQFSRRRFYLLMMRGVSSGVVALVLAITLVAFADWFWLLSEQVRWGLTGLAYFAVLAVVWATCLRRIVDRPAAREIAVFVEEAEPELRENLLSAIELATNDPKAIHDSTQFRSLLQGKVAAQMAHIAVPQLLPVRLVARWLFTAVVLIAISTFLLTSGDTRYRRLVTRALLPGANLARVSRIQIEVLQPTPHSLMMAENETVAVVVSVSGGSVSDVTLETFSEGKGSVRQPMFGRDEKEFAANIHIADQSVEYRVLAGDAITQKYRIESKPRPRVTAFHKTYRFPEYAQLSDRTVSEPNGDLIVLKGTTAEVVFELDQQVSQAELRIDRADSEEVQVVALTPVLVETEDHNSPVASESASSDGRRWKADIPVDEAGVYKVHLVSKETGFENIFSSKYEIRPQPDLLPRAGFVDQQDTTLLLPPNDILDMKAMAEDDLPLAKLEQSISVNGQEWVGLLLEVEALPASEGREVRASWQWDLLKHQLKAGDQILTKLIATDRMGNKGESIPLKIVVAAAEFDPDRHAVMERKASLYDDLADFSSLIEEQKKSALEMIDRLRQGDRDASSHALDRTALLDIASRQRDEASGLLEKIKGVERDMPPGADAYDVELIGKVIARIRHEYASTPTFLLQDLARLQDAAKQTATLDELKSTFERGAEDAKNVATHYQWLMTHNVLDGLAGDLHALYRQQKLIVDSPTQSWDRLLRQETIVVNQLQILERLIEDQGRRMTDSVDQGLMNLKRWSETQRLRLTDSMQSDDMLEQLRKTSQDLLQQFEQQQRVDSLDGGLPGRLVGIRKDLENRSGSLFVPLERIANTVRKEKQLAVEAKASQDSATIAKLVADVERQSSELDLKHLPTFGQFRIRRELTQNRRDADPQYAADVGLTDRAVQSLVNQHQQDSGSSESSIPDFLFEVAPAYRILEAGHQLILARDTLNLLINLERWGSQTNDAHIDHPRQWDVVQQTMELASQRLREAGIDGKLVGGLDEIRWSGPVRDANRKITERRWKRDLMVTAGHELSEIQGDLQRVVDDLEPVMSEARAIIAKYAPTIPELARQVAEQIRELEDATQDAADLAESTVAEAADPLIDALQSQQESINEQLENLLDALVEDANAQDILNDEERERARDADDSIALVQEPAKRMNRAMQQAQAAEEASEQAQELANAAEQQEQTAQALDLIAEHFERLEQGQEIADSRAALRQTEQDMGIARQMDQQFEPSEQLANLVDKDTTELIEELEAELQRNPAMQEALSEIARNALQDAQNTLEFSAQEEQNLQRANERADTQFQNKKRQLAEDLREMGAQASELARGLVAQASQAANLGKTPEAQQKLDKAIADLNNASAKANGAREEQLLEDLAQIAGQARDAIQEAGEALREAKETTATGKDEQIHADDTALQAARKDVERRQQQFVDQQKRTARDQLNRANDVKRRADQAVKAAENQLQAVGRQLEQARKNADKNPDNNGLQQAVAQAQARVNQEQQKVDAAKSAQSVAEQKATAAQQKSDEINNKPQRTLDAANPATQLSDAYAEDAIKVAEDLNRKADQLISEAQFGNELQPTRNQLASSQQQQASVAEDVAQTAADVQRAARHERRLNNASLSAEIQRAGEGIERVAQNEASNAESELEQATSEAEQMESALVNNESAPGNTETLQAQQALAASESALSQQAQQLGETLQPLLAQAEAAAANEPNGGPSGDPMPTDNPGAAATPMDGNSTPSNSESGSPLGQQDPGGALQSNQSPSSQPSFTEEELARGQQLARMLDELDQQRAAAEANAKAGDQPNGELAQANSSRPTSLALSAQAQRAAQAATRQRSQQQAMMAMNEGRTTEAMGFSDPTTPSQFELTDVARNENTDWGKLRSKSATELTRGSSEAVSEEYRMSVEAYFRVLSERSRNESK